MDTEVLVIGAGPGGYVASIRAAQLGKKVLVVEKDKLGGICLNVGCIPSKAVIHAAKLVRDIGSASEIGISTGPVSIDLKKMQAWKGEVVHSLTNGVAQLFKANGVQHLRGTATLTSPTTAQMKDANGAITEIRFQSCIVATGSRPIEIPGFAFDGQWVLDSTGALEMAEAPRNLVVIGGGFIGLEIGAAYAAFGSKVTVVEMLDQILPGQDPEIVRLLVRSLKRQGIECVTSAKAKGWKKGGNALELTVEVGGKEQTIPADKILVSVGRRPNTQGVGLEKAGVIVDAKGFVPIDEHARTNVPSIYAIGDIVPGPMLAHKASKEGLVAAAAIAGDASTTLDYRALPWAVFTDPEIASVGLSEAQARERGYEPIVGRFPFAASGRAKSTGETDGFVKVISDKRTDLLLGVHIIGADASNIIAEAAIAIEMGAYAEDLALTIHTHPTLPESLMEAAEAVHGKAIHIANR
ncbi:MAG: dihydrolipoyl dehydrogenase [Thermoplasmatota archaeon]